MGHNLSTADKFEIQQNFRRYVRLKERFDAAREGYLNAKSSRLWMAAVVALLFALASNFFMGVAAGLFGVYFYEMIRNWMQISENEEGLEQLDRWFATKKLKFEGRILYASKDEMLENPIDPFDDDCYR